MHFNRICTGSYHRVVSTLNAEGTSTYPDGFSNRHVQNRLIKLLYYCGSTSAYSSAIQGITMIEIMNSNGNWCAIKEGSTAKVFDAGVKGSIS